MSRFVIAFAALLTAGTSLFADASSAPRLSGPYRHANLTLFLIHGPDDAPNRQFLTLKEALEKKVIVVKETSNVNMLSVENTSPDSEVFIMSGDVVRGGKQDRVIAFDLIIPPKSGDRPLPAFCVEAGRWRKRGSEADKEFAASEVQVAGRGLKNAVNLSRQQGEVWKEVAEAQKRLSDNIGKQVNDPESPTSWALCMTDKDLLEKLAAYEKPLADVVKDKRDAVGVVTVVNGQVTGAESFCNADLFAKLWPKLLRSAATEALADAKKDAQFKDPTYDAVAAFLVDAMKGEVSEVAISPNAGRQVVRQTVDTPVRDNGNNSKRSEPPAESRANVRILKYTTPTATVFECRERSIAATCFHRSYIAKESHKPAKDEKPAAPNGQTQRHW